MARAIWSGSLSFGLVNVPVKLYSATSPKTVRFHQLSAKTGARIQQKRVDASTGDEVAFEDIVKGYELSPDHYVRIEPEELEAVAPNKTKSIELEEFVDGGDINPLAYDKGYFLVPDAGSAKAYRLLVQTMADSGRVGIGRLVLRTKQSLVAVRAQNGALVASTLLMADEINQSDSLLGDLPGDQPSDADVKMAGQLIDAMTVEFDHAAHEDTYRNDVLSMIERKAAGEVIEVKADEPVAAPTPDLMAGLTASLEAAKSKKAAKKPAAKKAAKAKVAA